ncbi:MAG TPA: hypothetical protein VL137_09295 [Polyangiaceae bacterium]|nr:hypothetical protein [Polyangiaceae bacterium]
MTDSSEPRTALTRPLSTVAAVGLAASVVSALWARGASTPFWATAVGAVVAVVQLLAVAYWVRSALGPGGNVLWRVLFSLLKLAVLFGGLGWLILAKVVPAVPFLFGYAALPLGIVVAQLTAGAAPTRNHSIERTR